MLNNKTILVTGGTGSFGNRFVDIVLKKYKPKKIIIFSRDEYKQHEMAKKYSSKKFPVRFFLGDVRDKNRLYRAFEGVDYVVHAAALKQVPALEYNPTEAVKTNVDGADNIVNAAIDAGVKKVVALSTDKAVNPVNLYGATKLVAEKIFIASNAYGGGRVKFSVVRYGNVLGSRGSVLPYFKELADKGVKTFPITDERMTRFWITLDQASELVFNALEESSGGEIFVPKAPSMKIVDLAKTIKPGCKIKIVGIRPGEKVHEVLISENESRQARDMGNNYIVFPAFDGSRDVLTNTRKGKKLEDGFVYSSNENKEWLSSNDLKKLIKQQ
jgi:UDP-N-acetylglucosamine 4,6-dehydratase/5-epimerase